MKISFLVVVPARGGSKGIPGKNLVFIYGQPLIKFSIDMIREVAKVMKREGHIFDVVISSDSEEILTHAKLLNVDFVKRPYELAQDDTPLDPVIVHAVKTMEEMRNIRYGVIITLQPTSPLLRPTTIKKAIEIFKMELSDIDTLVSASEERHLFWKEKDGREVPLYNERKNRQWLEPLYRETGGFVFSKREIIEKGKRFGEKVKIFKVPFPESIDIDSWTDLLLVEGWLKRRRVAIRVDGDFSIGLGHVYRAITLAKRLWAHEVRFFMNNSFPLGISKVAKRQFNIFTFSTEEELLILLRKYQPHVVVNDILDTTRDYIEKLKSHGYRVVNFEDLGEGALYADAVINALYEWSGSGDRFYYGYKYECLREDCYYLPPREEPSAEVKSILVTFGGTDINGTTLIVLKALEKMGLKGKNIRVIKGLGFRYENELDKQVARLKQKGYQVEVLKDVELMAPLIRNADLVISSNGRTVYEVAAMAVPLLVISQNSREATHLFSKICPGIINIGLANEIDDRIIKAILEDVINSYEIRKRMHDELKKYVWDIRKGLDRVVKIILGGDDIF